MKSDPETSQKTEIVSVHLFFQFAYALTTASYNLSTPFLRRPTRFKQVCNYISWQQQTVLKRISDKPREQTLPGLFPIPVIFIKKQGDYWCTETTAVCTMCLTQETSSLLLWLFLAIQAITAQKHKAIPISPQVLVYRFKMCVLSLNLQGVPPD